MRWLAFAFVGCISLSALPVGAQSNKATAEALFTEGRTLATAGKCSEAIPKF